jgi:hypothetical protein
MRSVTIRLLLLAVTGVSAWNAPASAQLRSQSPLPLRRPPVLGIGTTISVRRSCGRALARSGRPIQAFIQSYDSTSGDLLVSTLDGAGGVYVYPQREYQTPSCLPIESHDGRAQSISALIPEHFIVIWVSDIVITTRPPQFILNGIEVFDSIPVRR